MESLINIHKEVFNIEPNIIGMFWDNQSLLVGNISKAIKDNKPYDELELLSSTNKELYLKGELLF